MWFFFKSHSVTDLVTLVSASSDLSRTNSVCPADHVFEQILYSSNDELKESRKILQDIISRRLYKWLGETKPKKIQTKRTEDQTKPKEKTDTQVCVCVFVWLSIVPFEFFSYFKNDCAFLQQSFTTPIFAHIVSVDQLKILLLIISFELSFRAAANSVFHYQSIIYQPKTVRIWWNMSNPAGCKKADLPRRESFSSLLQPLSSVYLHILGAAQ